jgi:hypothetical protein
LTTSPEPARERSHFVAIAGMAGAVVAWALPNAWFLHGFLGSIAVTLLFAILAAARATDSQPLNSGARLLSFLAIGTSRPNASIPSSMASLAFKSCAAFTAGMGLGIIAVTKLAGAA